MNSDPLQRRMFAQQIMAQHARANQPMGILASSPQLMGAVQGFKDGGQVVKAEKGKFFYDPSNLSFMDRILQGQGIVKAREAENNENKFVTQINDGSNEGTVSLDSLIAQNNKARPIAASLNSKANAGAGVDGTSTTSSDAKSKINAGEEVVDLETNPSVSKFEDIDPSALINNKNKKALDEKKKTDESDPKGSDFEAGTTKPKFKKLRDAEERLKTITATINKPDPGAPIVQEFKTVLDEIQTELNKKGEELTAEEVDKQARKYAGLEDNADYDDDKHTAFWMALIKGGLATAAGESSNALTNIAKGLSIGVDAYGKDISNISAQERADRKALGEARYKVVQDSENKQLALRTAKVQYLQNKAQLLQSNEQFKESMDFKKVESANNNAFKAAAFEVSVFQAINGAEIAGETLDLKKEQLAQDKELRTKTLNATIKQIESSENLKLLGPDALKVLALGDDYATYKDGKLKVTDEGKELLETLMISKSVGKLTDLMESVRDAKENMVVGGVNYTTGKKAKTAAFLYYKGGYADRIAKAKEDPTKSDNITQIINNIKTEFAKASGGTFGDTPNNDAIVLP